MKWILLLFSVFYLVNMQAQISPGVYHAQDSVNGLNLTHELKIDNTYFIHTIYTKSPAGFVKTIGGFYKFENDVLAVKLEFNSNYEEDTATSVELPVEIVEGGLELLKQHDTVLCLELPQRNREEKEYHNHLVDLLSSIGYTRRGNLRKETIFTK